MVSSDRGSFCCCDKRVEKEYGVDGTVVSTAAFQKGGERDKITLKWQNIVTSFPTTSLESNLNFKKQLSLVNGGVVGVGEESNIIQS